MSQNVIRLLQSLNALLIVICLIVGIIYMIKSKKGKTARILIGAAIVIIPFIIMFVLNYVQFALLNKQIKDSNSPNTTAVLTADVVINGKTVSLPCDYDKLIADTGLKSYNMGYTLPYNEAWVTDGHSYIQLDKNYNGDVNQITIFQNESDLSKTNISFSNEISLSSSFSDVTNKLGKGDGGQLTNALNIANGNLYHLYTYKYSDIIFRVATDDNGKILMITVISNNTTSTQSSNDGNSSANTQTDSDFTNIKNSIDNGTIKIVNAGQEIQIGTDLYMTLEDVHTINTTKVPADDMCGFIQDENREFVILDVKIRNSSGTSSNTFVGKDLEYVTNNNPSNYYGAMYCFSDISKSLFDAINRQSLIDLSSSVLDGSVQLSHGEEKSGCIILYAYSGGDTSYLYYDTVNYTTLYAYKVK